MLLVRTHGLRELAIGRTRRRARRSRWRRISGCVSPELCVSAVCLPSSPHAKSLSARPRTLFGQRGAPEDDVGFATLHRCSCPPSSGRCSCPPRSGHCSGAPSDSASPPALAWFGLRRSPQYPDAPAVGVTWGDPLRSPAAGLAVQQCQGSCASRSGRGLSAYVESRLSALLELLRLWAAPFLSGL